MRTTRSLKKLILSVVALALAGCATGPDVRTDYNPKVDFTDYQTFGWVSELGTDRAGYSTLTTQYFMDAVRQEMDQLGYTYTNMNPDLLVNFYASMRERAESYPTGHPFGMFGYGYYGYRYGLYSPWPRYGFGIGPAYGYETVQYTVGTANVDVVDAENRQLIWEGVAEGRLTGKELKKPGQAIANTVDDIFKKFPTQADHGN
ncbi:MAG: DUF4136 domain-containing protein [Gammaproteobacteria bacterium]|nr:DUF4136 domain-containing protein [Gammaproteobacteria bacterium]